MVNKKLIDKYRDCSLCPGCKSTEKIFGTGNIKAEIAVISEAPGNEEAMVLLDKILTAVDIKKEDLYFTTAILCRPDKERPPTKQEYINCRKRLFEELYVIKPHMTLLVGNTALKTTFGDDYSIIESHGKWLTGLSMPCYFYFPIFHPAWILNAITDGEKKSRRNTMWVDIKEFKSGASVFDYSMNWNVINDDIVKFNKTKDTDEIK